MSLKKPIKSKFRRWTSDYSSKNEGRKMSPLRSGWFSISHKFIDMPERKKYRGHWFKISSDYGSCFRVLRMDMLIHKDKADNVDFIHIDWDGWLALTPDQKSKTDLDLTIKPIKIWDYWRLGSSHPDPAVRIAWVIALISLVLGVISVLLTVATI